VAQRLESLRGVVVPEPLLEWFVEFADRYIPQRHFPDKAVDLLEQSVAHAVTAGHASLTPDDAAAVARRLVSMPLDLTAGLEDLGEELGRRSLLRQEDARRIVTRLSVTMRALDFDDVRPNLVALFTGDALPALDRVAETIADMLFGSEMKVVRIDLGGMQDPHDTNQLLGAGPGYIGYDAALPLHRVKRMPFSVLVFENVHAAHPAVRNLLAQAFEVGHFTMNDGTTVDVSDAAVLLGAKNAAQIKVESRPIGFGARERKEEPSSTESRKELQRILGRELMLQVDFVVEALLADEGARTRWLTSSFLPELSDRFRQVGLDVRWDETIAAWLADRAGQPAQWRKIVDREITPLLIPWIERGAMENGTNVLVALRDGQVKVSERTS
jgi:ATP-dependent Clp protease ATP-binding subunit ClpC